MVGVNIYKRGRVYWAAAYYDGREVRWSLKTRDAKVAREAAKVYERRLAAGEPLRQRRTSTETFSAYSARWLESKASSRRKSTVAGYRHVVAEVLPTLGKLDMTEITRDDAREVAARLAHGGKGSRTAETVGRNLAYLQALFSDAIEEIRDGQGRARIAENPFARRSRLLEGLAVAAGKVGDDEEPDPYSAGEVAAILAACADRALCDRSDALKVLLGLDAGLRRSEVVALHRADLHLDDAWGRVVRRISRGELGEPKTRRSRRRFPLTDRLVAALREHIRELGLASPALFPARRKRGGARGYEDAKRFGDRFKILLVSAGVEVAEHPFHRLRHTFVSRLLAAGVEPYHVSQWAGHSSTAFTERVYAHWMPGTGHRDRINRPTAGEGVPHDSRTLPAQSSGDQ